MSREEQYAAICAALWAERDLMHALTVAMVNARLAGDDPFGGEQRSDSERSAMDRLALQDVLRAAMVESLVATHEAPRGATLPYLIVMAPEPWSTMLAEHGHALRGLLGDLTLLGDVQQLSLAEFLG